jgi:DUF917 family protein
MQYLAVGAAVLGSGGGGDPYLGKLREKQAIKGKGPVPLIGVDEFPMTAPRLSSSAARV